MKLDCSKLKKTLNWRPHWDVNKAIDKTVEWAKNYYRHGNVVECMDAQIRDFFSDEEI